MKFEEFPQIVRFAKSVEFALQSPPPSAKSKTGNRPAFRDSKQIIAGKPFAAGLGNPSEIASSILLGNDAKWVIPRLLTLNALLLPKSPSPLPFCPLSRGTGFEKVF